MQGNALRVIQKASDSPADLQGSLNQTHIVDLLQFLNLSKKTGELLLSGLPESGSVRIFFQKGQLTHAACGGSEGLDVLGRIHTWSAGKFHFIPNVLCSHHSIDLPLNHLLMEAARLFDEELEAQRSTTENEIAQQGSTPMKTLHDLLNELVHVDGINTAVLVGRDGFVIDGVVNSASMDADAIGAVISTGIGSAEVMGKELGVGELHQNMIEFRDGIILINLVGENAILAVVASLKTPLGNVRFQVKKRLPEIVQAIA